MEIRERKKEESREIIEGRSYGREERKEKCMKRGKRREKKGSEGEKKG